MRRGDANCQKLRCLKHNQKTLQTPEEELTKEYRGVRGFVVTKMCMHREKAHCACQASLCFVCSNGT